MKEKQKTVYYCEFCKKHRLVKRVMYFHERSCTLNPERICRVSRCSNNPNSVPRYAKGECPWCEFSKQRLAGTLNGSGFDVSASMEAWWAGQYNFDDRDEAAYEAVYR